MTTKAVAKRLSHTELPFGYHFVTPLALGSTLNPINSTMIATALAPIAADFHASVAEMGQRNTSSD